MAGKLIFRYASMNAGKSLNIITTAYNYRNRKSSLEPLILISDKMNKDYIQTRVGEDFRMKARRFSDLMNNKVNYDEYAVIIVDEAQFLNKEEVQRLNEISALEDKDVICYGLRTDFTGELFEGSHYLLAWADILEEMPTLCTECGHKARMNVRYVNKKRVFEGESVVIDGSQESIEYESVCRKHFLRK